MPILGFGHGHRSLEVAQRPDLTSTQAAVLGAPVFAMAQLAPKHINVAHIYDYFTIIRIMTLED